MTRASKLACLSICLMLGAPSAHAALAELQLTAAATATDNGPQDGTFDAFAPLNLGSVDNNGFTSFRTALEFDLASLPHGAQIHSAQVKMLVGFVEGTRHLALHGYQGDGTIELGDFSQNRLLDTALLSPPGSVFVTFDATSLVSDLVGHGDRFAGFNLREDPANQPNFEVLFFEMAGAAGPRLTIDYTAAVPEPSIMAALTIGLIGLIGWRRLR